MFANLMDRLSPRTATVFIFTTKANACRIDRKKANSDRNVPPFSAKACQGEIKKGKGGKKYKSVQIKVNKGNRKGKTNWLWKLVKEEPAAQKKPAREPVEVSHRNIKKSDGIAVKEALAGGAPPSFKDQIKGALMRLKDRNGSSVPAIKKFLNATPSQFRFVNAALKDGVKSGFFIKNKGKYKVSPGAKRPPRKKKKKKKKRTSLPKKKDKSPKKKDTSKKTFSPPRFRYMNAEAKADHVKQMKEKREQRESGKPKRPLTAYMLFVHEHQPKSYKEIGRLWRKTSQKEKQKYQTRAQNDRERYRREMETYVRPNKKKDAKKKSQKKKKK